VVDAVCVPTEDVSDGVGVPRDRVDVCVCVAPDGVAVGWDEEYDGDRDRLSV